MSNKALRVTVVFEYDGIDSADSPEAESWIEGINEEVVTLALAYGADAVWVDDACIVSGGHEVTQSQG
jgi:hypothetical protein